jgi:hypothetical protein
MIRAGGQQVGGGLCLQHGNSIPPHPPAKGSSLSWEPLLWGTWHPTSWPGSPSHSAEHLQAGDSWRQASEVILGTLSPQLDWHIMYKWPCPAFDLRMRIELGCELLEPAILYFLADFCWWC